MVSENIYVVGDIHGDWGSLNAFMAEKRPKAILQTGDFGWWPQFEVRKRTLYRQKGWSHKGLKVPDGCTVYWCDGNHENHEDLAKYSEPTELYKGVVYMPRGSTLTLEDGRRVLFMGGAESIDKMQRTLGLDWYEEEIINQYDIDQALSRDKVDIVISHTVPREWIPADREEKLNDPSRHALSRVLEHHKPKLWYSGHWHKESKGVYESTKWYSLDYPRHGGRWWRKLDGI